MEGHLKGHAITPLKIQPASSEYFHGLHQCRIDRLAVHTYSLTHQRRVNNEPDGHALHGRSQKNKALYNHINIAVFFDIK